MIVTPDDSHNVCPASFVGDYNSHRWELFDTYNAELDALGKEEWVTFRTHLYVPRAPFCARLDLVMTDDAR